MAETIRAAVFDMDGTLVDNMHVHRDAWRVFLERKGLTFDEEQYHRNNTGTITEIIPRFFPEATDPAEAYRLGMEKEAVYREAYRGHVEPLPGLVAFLDALRKADVRIALATAADRGNIDFTLDELGIRDRFDALVGSEDVQRGKPHPDVYLRAAERLGIEPPHCLAFEDSHSGIQAALAAGMRVVGLATTHSRGELEGYPLHALIDDYSVVEPLALLNKYP
ncbi:MAG: HAD family phosphatase [Chitinophagia bacterium]|nr:HAD family phosphatase [Chitinophagia bacterium]